MYNAGLILEGGGMRGVYTAGVLDAFLDAKIEFSSVYGVSAGSCHACSFLSKQRGRAYRVNVDYLDDPRYCGWKTYLKTGNIFGAKMLYSQIPDVLDPYDYQEFLKYKGKFFAVVTDVDTGEARYLRISDLRKQMWMIRASSSLPLLSKTIVVKGHSFLDGGVADSIPIQRSIKDGNRKNIVILTRDAQYRKGPNQWMPLVKLRYPHKKEFQAAMKNRYIVYNETLDFLKKAEAEGSVFVIRPESKVEVGRVEKDREKLHALYQQGLHDGEKSIKAMKEYLTEGAM